MVNTHCTNPLSVGVSENGVNPSSFISIHNTSARYYVHVGTDCSTNLEVQYKFCPLSDQNCNSPWTNFGVWGEYRTNDQGIARIDFEQSIPPGFHMARFRPVDSGYEWSNVITVQITNGQSGTLKNLEDYIVQVPGYVFIYNTDNILSGDHNNTTRIQIEEERTWCANYPVRPWRITKDDHDAFWLPYMAESLYHSSNDLNFRWMVASPTSPAIGVPPMFHNYLWVVGDRRYERSNIRDIQQGDELSRTSYGITDGDVPAYNLGPKQVHVPYYQTGHNSTLRNVVVAQDPNFCPNPGINSGSIVNYHWRIRIEEDLVTIGSTTYDDVLRIDFFEENVDPSGNRQGVLRESWYFARNVGLIQILTAHFDGVFGLSSENAPACKDAINCLNDTIETPAQKITLQKLYANPTFTVAVRAPGGSYTTSICVHKNGSQPWYDFKITNSDFTGYLEAELRGGVYKWLWVESGLVNNIDVSNIPAGTYTARFRVWAPNELYSQETNIQDYPIPWSNWITVIVQETPCP